MIIPVGSTTPILLGPFLKSDGTLFNANVTPVVQIYKNGSGGGVAAGTVSAISVYGVCTFTPASGDTGTAGELVLTALATSGPTSVFFIKTLQVGPAPAADANGTDQPGTAAAVATAASIVALQSAMVAALSSTLPAVIVAPVSANGNKLQIVRDAAYKIADATALKWNAQSNWPTNISSVTLTIRNNATDADPPPLQVAGTVSGLPVQAIIELTSAQTLALTASLNGYDKSFDLWATLTTGNKYPLVAGGVCQVVQNVYGTR